jgi:hypothetical protein
MSIAKKCSRGATKQRTVAALSRSPHWDAPHPLGDIHKPGRAENRQMYSGASINLC